MARARSEEDRKRVQLVFRSRPREPAELHGDIIEAPRREARPEMPEPGHDDARDVEPRLGARLIEDQGLEAFLLEHAGEMEDVS